MLALFGILYLHRTSCAQLTAHQKNIQTLCMRNVVLGDSWMGDDRQVSSLLNQPGVNPFAPCSWRGVKCTLTDAKGDGGVVDSIIWNPNSYSVANKISHRIVKLYRWFPPTITALDITSQGIYGPIDTRFLPRALVECRMSVCYITGTFAVESLPRNLVYLSCATNSIMGTLNLTALPPNIERMDFSFNDLQSVTVDNGKLPKGLQLVKLFGMRSNMKKVVIGGGEVDKRINLS